ncbi:MAG: flap endonuclease-1 [Candidatus Aenigmarchaeota archaeon]|nr:flap endonuclease-1 [Candidatus Aenigmarchaeota archaeon]
MGVKLTALVEGRAITLDELFDKQIAIDAFNWIYQFLSIIRQKDGQPLQDSQGRVTSHLTGLFYRTLRVMEAGIKPVYVFDGEPPEFKKEVAAKRRDIRAEAVKEWKEALAKGEYAEARKYAMRSSTITDEIIEDCKKLLDAMGVPCVQAPSEGEALCSVMARKNDAYAVATQDYDSLLFGAPRLIRNLSITGKRRRGKDYIDVKPEIIILSEVLEKLDINHDQLIILGILAGTDYDPEGVAGYGPKKALDLVRQKKTLKSVLKEVVWDFSVSAEEIFDFFSNPTESTYTIEFRELDPEAVKKILCDEHDFSVDRIDSALKKLDEEKKAGQKSLQKWF